MTDNSNDAPQGPIPGYPIPEGKPWTKFKLVTKLGMHYDILFPGEMSDLAIAIRSVGYFMNPAIYVQHDCLSHILAISAGQQAEGEGGNVTTLRPLQ